MKKIVFLYILVSLTSCDPGDNRLTIINNTNHTIVIGDRYWVSDPKEYLKDKDAIDNFDFHEHQIAPKETVKMPTKGRWDERFVNNNTMVLLVYNKDTILKKRLKNENYDIEQIIYVSHNYVEANDWIIQIDSTSPSKIINL